MKFRNSKIKKIRKKRAPSRIGFHKRLMIVPVALLLHEQVHNPANDDREDRGEKDVDVQLFLFVLVPWYVLLRHEADDDTDPNGLYQRNSWKAKGRDQKPAPEKLQRHTIQQVRYDH